MKKLLVFVASFLFTASASAALKNNQTFGDWKSACEGNECGLLQVSYDDKKSPIGRFILRRMDDNKIVAFVTVPLGVSLKGGLGVAVDRNEIGRAAFDFCDETGCTAIFPLEESQLGKFRKGSKMQVAVFILDQPQAMEFSLKGISEALKNL